MLVRKVRVDILELRFELTQRILCILQKVMPDCGRTTHEFQGLARAKLHAPVCYCGVRSFARTSRGLEAV